MFIVRSPWVYDPGTSRWHPGTSHSVYTLATFVSVCLIYTTTLTLSKNGSRTRPVVIKINIPSPLPRAAYLTYLANLFANEALALFALGVMK